MNTEIKCFLDCVQTSADAVRSESARPSAAKCTRRPERNASLSCSSTRA